MSLTSIIPFHGGGDGIASAGPNFLPDHRGCEIFLIFLLNLDRMIDNNAGLPVMMRVWMVESLVRFMRSLAHNSFGTAGTAEASVVRAGTVGVVGTPISLLLILVLIVGRDMRHGSSMKLT